MVEWFRWWKNKTFVTVLLMALFTMVVSFLFAYFISWGWILTIITTALGGLSIRYIIRKRLDEIS